MMQKISLSYIDQLAHEKNYDLYAGTWCSLSSIPKNQIISNPISDPDTLKAQSKYVDGLTEKICSALAQVLNLHFEVHFSERYWKIVLSAFVSHWVSSNYYKYLIVKKIQSNILPSESVIINTVRLPENFYKYKSTTNYIECALDDYFIHFEFQKIIFFLLESKAVVNKTFSPNENIYFDQSHGSFKETILKISGFGGSYYLGRIYNFSIKEKLSIHLSLFLRGVIYFLKSFFERNKWQGYRSKKSLQKQWSFTPEDEFEQYVNENIIDAIPDSFTLEIPKQSFLMRVNTIITTTSYNDPVERFNIARIVENNGKWFSPQHGGGYGQMNSCSPSSVDEYSISDAFLSWGWLEHGDFRSNAIPLPSPMLSKLPRYKKENQTDILIVSTTARKIPFRFNSYLTINTKEEYRKTQLRFLQNLDLSILPLVIYREHFEVVKDKDDLNIFIELNKIRRSSNLATIAAKDARLVVVDHLGTTPLQTFVMNIPTILYWPVSYFDLTPEAHNDFLILKKYNLWFDDPLAASKFINENYNHIWTWWNSTEVQTAKNNFIKKYALNSDDYLKVWKKFIANQG